MVSLADIQAERERRQPKGLTLADIEAEKERRLPEIVRKYPELRGVDLTQLSRSDREALIAKGIPVPLSGPRVEAAKHGFSLGLSEELAGAGAAVGQGLVNVGQALTGQPQVGSPQEAYSDTVSLHKLQREQFSKEHPVQSGALTFGGGILTGAPAASALKNAAARGIGPLVKESVKEGAVLGGIAGAGFSEGGVQERAGGAATGAAVGGTLGAAIPVLASRMVRFFQSRSSGNMTDQAASVAYRQMRDRLAKDLGGKGKAEAALRVWVKNGSNPEDLVTMGGEHFKSLITHVAADEPESAVQLVNAFRAEQPTKIRQGLEQAVNQKSKTVRSVLDDIKFVKETQAAPLYETAHAIEVPQQFYQKNLRVFVQQQAGKPAIRKAEELARVEGDFETAGMLRLALEGNETTLNIKALDYVKRGVDDAISAARKSGADQKARALNNTKREWLATIDEAFPEYKEARGVYAGAMETQDALLAGRDFLKPSKTPDEITRELAEMNPSEREFYRVGVADAIDTFIATRKDNANKALGLVDSEMMRSKVRALIADDPAAADAFIEMLEESSRRYQRLSDIDPRRGSPTEPKLRGAERAADEVGQLFTSPGNTLRRGARAAGRAIDRSRNRQISSILAEVFFEGRPVSPPVQQLPPPGSAGASALTPGIITLENST